VREVHSDELSRRTQFRRRFLFVRATKPTWLGKRREFRPYTKYFHIPFATAALFSSPLSLSLFLSHFYSPLPSRCLRPLSLYGRYQRVLGFIRRNENFALPPFPQRKEEKQFKFRSFIKRNVSLSFSHSSPPPRYFHPPWAPTLLLSFLSPRGSCLPPSSFRLRYFGTRLLVLAKNENARRRDVRVSRESDSSSSI